MARTGYSISNGVWLRQNIAVPLVLSQPNPELPGLWGCHSAKMAARQPKHAEQLPAASRGKGTFWVREVAPQWGYLILWQLLSWHRIKESYVNPTNWLDPILVASWILVSYLLERSISWAEDIILLCCFHKLETALIFFNYFFLLGINVKPMHRSLLSYIYRHIDLSSR